MMGANPQLVARWGASRPPVVHRGAGVTVINFNTADQTLRCLSSLAACSEAPAWILVLDNASGLSDYEKLRSGCGAFLGGELRLYRSDVNIGFAAGSNFLLNELLQEPECCFLGLLNNDAVASPAFVTSLVDALAVDSARIGLVGGRMHKLYEPERVDTLGISIYASLMPADRHDLGDPFFGPTGGCCFLSRELVEMLKTVSGYCFDERYFCYCEDTDLVMRANLLGYEPAYVDEVLALHEGQASSGGGFNRFIAYHGIRNTIWLHLKLFPRSLLLRQGGWLFLAHFMAVVRHFLAGNGAVLWLVYRDAWARRGEFLAEYQRFRGHVKLTPRELRSRFAAGFYRRGYFRLVLGQLWMGIGCGGCPR